MIDVKFLRKTAEAAQKRTLQQKREEEAAERLVKIAEDTRIMTMASDYLAAVHMHCIVAAGKGFFEVVVLSWGTSVGRRAESWVNNNDGEKICLLMEAALHKDGIETKRDIWHDGVGMDSGVMLLVTW